MAKNYLLGIGGTGARVIESVVHCCAAGFGPPELNIVLIDPDQGNGNLNWTATLIRQYQESRALLRERRSPDVRLFGTQITTPDPFVWNIFADENQTLGGYINHENVRKSQPALAQFMELLFSDAELTTRLNEGFRGHPSIGAVVMANARDDIEPWKSFWNDVESSTGEHDVRVFLVGSIFGGTGAAGVPTFGAPNMLKWRDRATIVPPEDDTTADADADAAGSGRRNRQRAGSSKIFLGASLVLPYFSIDTSTIPAAGSELFVTHADFPAATKAALRYYDEKHANRKLAFDQVYLIGDSVPQPVGTFSAGNKKQKNRPHYVELATALAAFDFFRLDATADGVKEGFRFFATSRDAAEVDWRALPVTRDPERAESLQTEFKRRIAAMAVFGYALNTVGLETLEQPHGEIADAWYNRNFRFNPRRAEDAEKDPRRGRAALEKLAGMSHDFLAWIAALDDGDGRVQLVDRSKVFTPSSDGSPARLLSPTRHAPAIGAVLKAHPGKQHEIAQFRNALDRLEPMNASMGGVDRYVNLFYEAALAFVGDNWRIERPTA